MRARMAGSDPLVRWVPARRSAPRASGPALKHARA